MTIKDLVGNELNIGDTCWFLTGMSYGRVRIAKVKVKGFIGNKVEAEYVDVNIASSSYSNAYYVKDLTDKIKPLNSDRLLKI